MLDLVEHIVAGNATSGSAVRRCGSFAYAPVTHQNAPSSHRNQIGRTVGPFVASRATCGPARNSSTSRSRPEPDIPGTLIPEPQASSIDGARIRHPYPNRQVRAHDEIAFRVGRVIEWSGRRSTHHRRGRARCGRARCRCAQCRSGRGGGASRSRSPLGPRTTFNLLARGLGAFDVPSSRPAPGFALRRVGRAGCWLSDLWLWGVGLRVRGPAALDLLSFAPRAAGRTRRRGPGWSEDPGSPHRPRPRAAARGRRPRCVRARGARRPRGPATGAGPAGRRG